MAERGTEFRSRLWLKDSMALFFEANANSSASPMEKIQHGAKSSVPKHAHPSPQSEFLLPTPKGLPGVGCWPPSSLAPDILLHFQGTHLVLGMDHSPFLSCFVIKYPPFRSFLRGEYMLNKYLLIK